MFIKNKKGLSDIIATVLIVLLAIAAVVIVWGFVSKFLNTGGKAIDAQGKCLEVEVRPISCTNTTNSVTVRVQVLRGTPAKASALLTFTDNSVDVNKTTISSGATFVDVLLDKSNKIPKSVKTSVIILDQEGKDYPCPESPVIIQCA